MTISLGHGGSRRPPSGMSDVSKSVQVFGGLLEVYVEYHP